MGKDSKALAIRRLTGEEIMEETKKQACKAWGKILPFGAQVVASAAAYSVGITATQLVGFVLKVSCATPVLGPTMGLVGVGLANVLAGQASRHTRKMVVTKSHPLAAGFWEAPNPEDMVLDAVMGVCIFKALGGRFSSVMPSDLTKPGALAFESIPARADHSEAYAQPSVKRELARIFRRDGCHHCGSRKAPVIGDHMPPNKLMQGNKDQLGKWMGELPIVGKVVEVLGGGRRRGPIQRFYPQCQRCSIKQATAVRNGKRVLVLHLHWPRRGRGEHLAGVLVGLRYNAPDLGGPSGGGDSKRRSGKWASLTLAAAGPLETTHIMELRSPTDGSSLAMQHMPCPLAPELSSGSLSRGWANSTGSASPYLQIGPLLDDAAGARPAAAAWQQQDHKHLRQQQQQQALSSNSSSNAHGPAYLTSPRTGAYASGVVSYTPQGGAKVAPQEGAKMGGSSKGGMQGGMALMQHAQQRARGVSGPGDEAARLPDQNVSQQGTGESQGAALMAPEHAKARAEAAFERHFAPGLNY